MPIPRSITKTHLQAAILMVAHQGESLRFCDALLELPGMVFRPAPYPDRQ